MKHATLDERFDEKWKLDPDTGCWLWSAGREFAVGRRWVKPARYAFERWIADVPDGARVYVDCGRLSCVKPAHLSLRRPSNHNGKLGAAHLKAEPGYMAIHKRARSAFPRRCLWCGTEADLQVALLETAPEANLRREGELRYSLSLDDYVRLCRRHHHQYDGRLRDETGRFSIAGRSS